MIRWETPTAHVGLAIIDRQDRRNALDAELCDDLRRHLEASHAARAVIVTGEGRAFCAGADLAQRAGDAASGLDHGGGDSFRPAFEALLDAVVDHPAPVIAAIDGPALGAGMQLAVAGDFRIASPAAAFGIPASRLGVLLSPANIRRLALLVGHATARDLLMTGRTVDVAEADRLGVVHRHADDARRGALELATELAALAPLTVRGHKRALNLISAACPVPEGALAEIRDLERAAFASADLQEGLAAFAEKRSPWFEGR